MILFNYSSTTLFTCMLAEGIHICFVLKTVFDTETKFRKHTIYVIIGWSKYASVNRTTIKEKNVWKTAKKGAVPDTTSNVQPISKTICRDCKRTLLYL